MLRKMNEQKKVQFLERMMKLILEGGSSIQLENKGYLL